MKTIISPVFIFVVTVGIMGVICISYLIYDIVTALRRWWLR